MVDSVEGGGTRQPLGIQREAVGRRDGAWELCCPGALPSYCHS